MRCARYVNWSGFCITLIVKQNFNKGDEKMVDAAENQERESRGSRAGRMQTSRRNQNPMNIESFDFEGFVEYAKQNWKVILSELVAAGVTAYLAYSEKQRKSRHN